MRAYRKRRRTRYKVTIHMTDSEARDVTEAIRVIAERRWDVFPATAALYRALLSTREVPE